MNSCQISQAPRLADFPTPSSIHVPLFEGETAGDEFSSWPQAVQNLHTRELDRWAKRNPDLDIVDQKHFFVAGFRICVTEFHTTAKAMP